MQAAGGAPLSDGTAHEKEPLRRPRRPPGRLALVLALAAVVVVVDAVSKVIAVDRLSDRGPVRVIDGVLELTLTRNAGAAFSIGVGATVVFSVVAVGVVAVIVRTAARLRSVPWAIALGLLLGGALGNLGDRLFRSPGPFRGAVVDWIRLPHWPVFNIADACIVLGAVVAVLVSLRGHQFDGTRRPPPHGATGVGPADGPADAPPPPR